MINNEIGSNFLIEESLIEGKNQLDNYLIKFAKKKEFFDSGRSALRYLCKSIKNKTVLLPNYICDSMIQPFIKADFEISFYEIDEYLNPIIESINSEKIYGAFLHLGYFGVYTSENLIDKIVHMRNNGTIIIEDITHTVFSRRDKFVNSDYYICSIRKWFGIPDGGILLSNNDIEIDSLSTNEVLIDNYLKASKLKKNKIIYFEQNSRHIEFFTNAEESLNISNTIHTMSPMSNHIISGYDFNNMIDRRKKNAYYLTKEINKLGLRSLHFDFVSNTPLFIPIFFKTKQIRDFYKDNLVKSKIFTPVHWPKPNIYDIKNKLYDLELSIPCDQRYSIEDMKHIINEIKKIMEWLND